MGRLPTRTLTSRFARLAFGHADTAQGRVGVQSVARGCGLRDAARVVVEQVGRHDLEVVVGGVREGSAPVAVPHGPDPGQRSVRRLVVDLDVAALVRFDTPAASRPSESVLGTRPTASSRCEPSTSCGPLGAVDADRDLGHAALAHPHALGPQAKLDALPLEEGHAPSRETSGSSRPISTACPCSTMVTPLPKRRNIWAELQTDVAATDDDQVLGHAKSTSIMPELVR